MKKYWVIPILLVGALFGFASIAQAQYEDNGMSTTTATTTNATTTATGTVDIWIVKHLCPASVQSSSDLNNLGSFGQKLAVCPTIVMPDDNYASGTVGTQTDKYDFDFVLRYRDQDGDLVTYNDEPEFRSERLSEADLDEDLNNDGNESEDRYYDVSAYVYRDVPRTDATFTETDLPGNSQFIGVSFMSDEDEDALISAGNGIINLDTRDSNGQIIVHVYNGSTDMDNGDDDDMNGDDDDDDDDDRSALLEAFDQLVEALQQLRNALAGINF